MPLITRIAAKAVDALTKRLRVKYSKGSRVMWCISVAVSSSVGVSVALLCGVIRPWRIHLFISRAAAAAES